MKLYYAPQSPFARKVRAAIIELGLADRVVLEYAEVVPGRPNVAFAESRNPLRKIPALVTDGGETIFDSTVICEYLEDRYPQPSLYPADPRLRAACRLVEDLADTQLDAATYAVAIVELGRHESHPALHETAGRDLRRLYDALEQRLGGNDFLCGNFSLADIAIAPHLMAAAFLGFPLDPTKQPALLRWMERMQERPAVARDNADVLETLQRLRAEGRPAFDPYRVQWRSDRLEWVIKNGFADWFADEMRAGRVFFPVTIAR